MPRPARRTLSPFLRCLVVNVTRSPSTASACFFGSEWLSDNAAARCLSVTVATAAPFAAALAGAALAGAALFLAAGAAFLAGGMTVSLGSSRDSAPCAHNADSSQLRVARRHGNRVTEGQGFAPNPTRGRCPLDSRQGRALGTLSLVGVREGRC